MMAEYSVNAREQFQKKIAGAGGALRGRAGTVHHLNQTQRLRRLSELRVRRVRVRRQRGLERGPDVAQLLLSVSVPLDTHILQTRCAEMSIIAVPLSSLTPTRVQGWIDTTASERQERSVTYWGRGGKDRRGSPGDA